MDLDEWEVIPSTKPCNFYSFSDSKELPTFLGPKFHVESDYFKCPSATQQHQQQPEKEAKKEVEAEEEKVEEEEEEEEEKEEKEEEFKDIGISTEFDVSTEVKAPANPCNWVEPETVVFDRSSDKFEKEDPISVLTGRKNDLVEEDKNSARFSFWGLTVHGIGAICSFGVATAATLCVFALGAASASNTGRLRPSPNIQFQIYSHDKRIKEVVQRATEMNYAISAPRGITIPSAQISFGGHYEGI